MHKPRHRSRQPCRRQCSVSPTRCLTSFSDQGPAEGRSARKKDKQSSVEDARNRPAPVGPTSLTNDEPGSTHLAVFCVARNFVTSFPELQKAEKSMAADRFWRLAAERFPGRTPISNSLWRYLCCRDTYCFQRQPSLCSRTSPPVFQATRKIS